MKNLVIIISMFLASNLNATEQLTETDGSLSNAEYIELENELLDLELIVFEDLTLTTQDINVEDINVIEIEEEVEIDFNTKEYLPERFVATKGMHDIDWTKVELIELEEEVDLNDNYPLPKINIQTNNKSVLVGRID